MTLHLWLAFCAANLLTSLSPGPGALAAVNAGLAHGGRRALGLVMGLQAALLLQLAVVGIGAGALLATSDTAFRLLRWLGAAYLAWLGLMQWREILVASNVGLEGEKKAAADPRQTLFRRGLLINLSNPKAVLFQAALVPHFIVADRALFPQYLIIALTMCTIDTAIMGLYAQLAHRLAGRWRARQAMRPPFWRPFLFGALFILFGILLFSTG